MSCHAADQLIRRMAALSALDQFGRRPFLQLRLDEAKQFLGVHDALKEAGIALVLRQVLTAERALEIAASGGHNLLLLGPPGSGKTLLARRLPTILPDMAFDEALETTKIRLLQRAVSATGSTTYKRHHSHDCCPRPGRRFGDGGVGQG